MKTTGVFKLHRFDQNIKDYNSSIILKPFGDVHRDSPLCHEEKWKEFLDECKETKNAIFLGMGDYLDMLSSSERIALNTDLLHESSKHNIEKLYLKEIDRFCDEISFMKGRLVGLIEGNHYTFSSGMTSTQLMCHKLECEYLGVSAFVRIGLRYDSNHRSSVDLWVHHMGAGGGRTLASSVNGVSKMTEVADADVYLAAHDHRRSVNLTDKLYLRESSSGGLRLENKRILLIRTGSFLRGYGNNGESSYVAERCLAPSDLGSVSIEMKPERIRKKNGKRADIRIVNLRATL